MSAIRRATGHKRPKQSPSITATHRKRVFVDDFSPTSYADSELCARRLAVFQCKLAEQMHLRFSHESHSSSRGSTSFVNYWRGCKEQPCSSIERVLEETGSMRLLCRHDFEVEAATVDEVYLLRAIEAARIEGEPTSANDLYPNPEPESEPAD